MLDESIVDNAPEGATHYRPATRTYYKKVGNALKFWCRDEWIGYYLGRNRRRELQSLGHKVCQQAKHAASTGPLLSTLPKNVRPHVSIGTKTNEFILWDEEGSHEVCRSHYPLVIVAAMETYSKEYSNKH